MEAKPRRDYAVAAIGLSEDEAFALLDMTLCSQRELDETAAGALLKLAEFCKKLGSSGRVSREGSRA